MNIINDFHKDNDGLATNYYIILPICHSNIYGVSLLSSLNTFIALFYPLRYKRWFSKKRIVICLIIIFLIGLINGIGMICFHPCYKYSISIKGYIVAFKSLDVIYYLMAFSIVINISIVVVSTIMNTTSAVKFAKYYQTINTKNSQNVSIFLYAIINFFIYTIVVVYTFGKIVNFMIVQSDLFDSIAQQIAYWNVDFLTLAYFIPFYFYAHQ
uniref:7TM_GPCR_Srx domain-containing protein n=1 Tax=Strongyloides venezuelensis TaxID=75913 RepID=A0A0K0FTU8_STRVS